MPSNNSPRNWIVFRELTETEDWWGNPHYRYLLLTNVEGSDKYHWSGRPQWTTKGDDWEFVKSYGVFSNGSEFEDNILDAFAREYRMPVAVNPLDLYDKSAPEGWLSPEGLWYPVEYGGHTPEAEDICQLILKTEEYTHGYAHLHKIGWVSVHQGYILTDGYDDKPDRVYSIEMLRTLKLIESLASNENYLTHLGETMRRVENHVPSQP